MTDSASLLLKQVNAFLAAPMLKEDFDALAGIPIALKIRQQADELLASSVAQARREGATWQRIGDALGVTRQAAFQQFGKPAGHEDESPKTLTLAEARESAAEVIHRLSSSRWNEVIAQLDPSVSAKLNAQGLSIAWTEITATMGDYVDHGPTTASHAANGITVTDTLVHFAQNTINTRISFHDDRRIAGLYFLPAEQ